MTAQLKKKAAQVYKRLTQQHPNAVIELNYTTPIDLLVATVLSAQCTDVRVNEVTKTLFKKLKTAEDYVRISQAELETLVQSTGFFRQKAKNIKAAMKVILEEHNGEVPGSMEELVKLPGVGRKTANVVLGNAFGIPGLPVDTHVNRLCNRIGLTKKSDPVEIEFEIYKLLPKKDWTQFSHTLIFHGRRVCNARKPRCQECSITDLCDFFGKEHP